MLIATCLTFLCVVCSPADDGRQLIGVWKLQTFEVELQDTGEHKAPLERYPNGYGVFTAEGRTMGILTAESRDVPQPGADMAAALRSMIACSEMYRLKDDR